ncbi:MAG: response regulator [Desulfobacterales bacterium]|nr:response regulator [Desulfobacterales bacterium]
MPRILVVDDEDSIRFSFRKILSRAGYDVIVASHMIDAKAILPANEFDVAIIDRLLENYDGIDLMKHIKRVQPFCETILVSAYPTFKSASETLDLDAFAYLTKPVKKNELCEAVGAAAAKAGLKREAKHQERVFQSLFESLPNGVAVCDLDQSIRFVNRAFTRILGYTKEELLGKPMPAPPEWDERRSKAEIDDLLNGKPVMERETERLTKGGGIVNVAITHSLGAGVDGKPTDILIILRDISEKKKLEARLHHNERLESIGTLAGGIAHDFNNILSSLIGFTELAIEDANKNGMQYANLQEVLVAGNRAKDLVHQILMFSKQNDQELKPIKMKLIVNETLKLMRASLPSTIEIRGNLRTDSLVLADPTRLNQVVMNLCTNAGHAMQEQGGVMEVGLFDVELDSKSTMARADIKPGKYVRLIVSDSGHGMSAKVMNQIFDPFFTTKERAEGTGLGLSMVHGIVTSFGGCIIPYSKKGKGSTFSVYLPVIEGEAQSEIEIRPPLPTGTERILFIDDEPPIVKMSQRMLRRLGYTVESRTSSIEALALFKAKHDSFDLVITDMTMPNMTGDELSREILRIRPDIPIILCTGFSQKITEDEARNMGIGAFITKPILSREIAETIRSLLD